MMSSQIYSRYVPPKKNEKKASPKQSAAISALKATPTTEHDASSTYARYVPSKSKRRRIEDSSEKSHNATTDTPAAAPHHVSPKTLQTAFQSQLNLLGLLFR
jgi:hypothetical protein